MKVFEVGVISTLKTNCDGLIGNYMLTNQPGLRKCKLCRPAYGFVSIGDALVLESVLLNQNRDIAGVPGKYCASFDRPDRDGKPV